MTAGTLGGKQESEGKTKRQNDKTTQTKHMFNKSSIIMKQFKNLILAGALVLGLAGFAVSCDKYGDDIDELTSRVGKLETQLTDLQTKIDAGVIVTGVTQTAGGVTIQTSNGTYTITNGEKGEKGEKGDKGDQGEKGQGSVVTLGENGNWFIDGVDTGIPYKGEKGDKGEDGAPGKDGKASVVEIGENGNWFIDGVDTGVKAGADGALSAVWDPETGTLTLKNVEGYEGDYVLNLTAAGVTSVELVASIDGANITNKINFATVTEKENVFGIVDPEDGKTLLPGGLKFTEGAETQRDVNVIVRVSPVNYALKAEDISFQNGNGETLDWVKVVSVEPYKRLYTRAGEPETGLWKIKVALAKDYVKKDFEAVTKVGKKNVLFAVKAQDAVSTYDVAFVYEEPQPESYLNVMVDDKSIEKINNRFYKGDLRGKNLYIESNSFANGGRNVFTYKEMAWATDTAYTKPVTGKYKVADNKTDFDYRNGKDAYNAFQDVPITITIPKMLSDGKTPATDKNLTDLIPNENIRAMYVTLDYEACAVESAPSEWVSWNSYTYTGLNEVVEGAETEIIIDSDRAINDFIGFRVYAVNYDGTLVDPDGRAFYVKVGADVPVVDLNKGSKTFETAVMPKANPASASDGTFNADQTSSESVKVSWTDIDLSGAASHRLELLNEKDEPTGHVPFSVTFVAKGKDVCTFTDNKFTPAIPNNTLNDIDFSQITEVYTTPTDEWKAMVDNMTYTAKLTIYDNVKTPLATLTVSMTKVMPTEDPEGAFEFKSDKLENGTLYAYLIPYFNGKENWNANNVVEVGRLDKVANLYNVKEFDGYDQKLYYYTLDNNITNPIDVIFAASDYDSKLLRDKHNTPSDNLRVDNIEYKVNNVTHRLIDNTTTHTTYVVYNYGPITYVPSVNKVYDDPKKALTDLDGKAGTFRVKEGNDVNYYVKVPKVNTVYCSVYNDTYTWKWADRTDLFTTEEKSETDGKDFFTKKKDGKYVNTPDNYTDQLEVVNGDDLRVFTKFIYGVSSWDGRYNRVLNLNGYFADPDLNDFKNSLILNPYKTPNVHVITNGIEDELYECKNGMNLLSDDTIILTAVDKKQNITHDVTATLVIECLDMYRNEVQVEVPFTIKKR